MATTDMTVEFGTIHHYSSLEENSEACLCSSLNRLDTKINWTFNKKKNDILVQNNHVLNSNVNTN